MKSIVTPASKVSVAPEATTMSPTVVYGLLANDRVVSELNVPEIFAALRFGNMTIEMTTANIDSANFLIVKKLFKILKISI